VSNLETNVSATTTTNPDGIYVIPDLRPATYRLTVQKEAFRTVVKPSLQLYVQDAVNENFTLAIGPVSESVTVMGDTFGLQTDSAAVSTFKTRRSGLPKVPSPMFYKNLSSENSHRDFNTAVRSSPNRVNGRSSGFIPFSSKAT
jgi:hypothetical protein